MPAFLGAWMWVAAGCRNLCAGGTCLVAEPVPGPVDECSGFCLMVAASGADTSAWIESSEGLRVGPEVALRAGERVEVCTDSVDPLASWFAAVGCEGACRSAPFAVDVRAFGYDLGLERAAGAPPELLAPLTLGPRPETPVLTPKIGAWDAVGVIAPTAVVWQGVEHVFYAGTADEGEWGDYAIGTASRPETGGALERLDQPILGATSDWDAYGQNTPEAVVRSDGIWLYYDGRAAIDGDLSIGVATSADGLHFTTASDNPVLAGSGVAGSFDERSVAHPSVVDRDGFTELWYASGLDEIGYAVSADGVHFERYCKNPVFSGLGRETWDRAQVKAPEVVLLGDHYAMTYSGCDKTCYQIGWAESRDGLRWAPAEEPLLGPDPAGTWDDVAVQDGFLQEVEDGFHLWYAGTDGEHQQIAVIDAAR